MTAIPGGAVGDLLSGAEERQESTEPLADGAVVLRGFARAEAGPLMTELHEIAAAAPLRHMVTPGGHRMSVAMTNCGTAGWVTDRKGYRYDRIDPETGQPWPP
ncbi:MAG: alpha-ketoglutarate-dependent dioxygenase AlkB, partial [Rhodospirillales bacterium]|nr:alpha-ketoglutarate-dependent dioxygenase AlkB [Rhodospirillales bacterium]